MIEERENVHHALHGSCEVIDVLYLAGTFQGAKLKPLTEKGLASLQLASLSKNPIFVESDEHLIVGA
jgi:hypothetical protein